jgi:hypothetical protein
VAKKQKQEFFVQNLPCDLDSFFALAKKLGRDEAAVHVELFRSYDIKLNPELAGHEVGIIHYICLMDDYHFLDIEESMYPECDSLGYTADEKIEAVYSVLKREEDEARIGELSDKIEEIRKSEHAAAARRAVLTQLKILVADQISQVASILPDTVYVLYGDIEELCKIPVAVVEED